MVDTDDSFDEFDSGGSVDGDNVSISDDVLRDGHDDPPDGTWAFNARSLRGAKVFDGLTKRVMTEPFELKYNPVDEYLQDKMNKEVKHLLHMGRMKIHGIDEGQMISALDAFACALPPSFLLLH